MLHDQSVSGFGANLLLRNVKRATWACRWSLSSLLTPSVVHQGFTAAQLAPHELCPPVLHSMWPAVADVMGLPCRGSSSRSTWWQTPAA